MLKPLDVVLTFFIHSLAVFGAVGLSHYFFPGSPTWMFMIVMCGMLLINWHKNPEPNQSVIGLFISLFTKGKDVVQAVRPSRKLIDNLPPEPKKNV